jgi:hypothetical protein
MFHNHKITGVITACTIPPNKVQYMYVLKLLKTKKYKIKPSEAASVSELITAQIIARTKETGEKFSHRILTSMQ